MTEPIDVAYVDIVARVKDFRKDIKKIVENEVQDLEGAFNEALRKIDEVLVDTAEQAEDSFEKVETAVENAAEFLGEAFDSQTKKVRAQFESMAEDVTDDIDSITTKMEDDGRLLGGRISTFWRRGMDSIQSAVAGAGRNVLGVLSSITSTLFSMPALIAAVVLAVPSLVGILVTLGSALSQVVGLVATLPAGLSVLAAAIAPVAIGFQGFGEALDAIMSKDPKKIQEALDKLAPSARSVAREVQALMPVFSNIQDAVQQALFAPLQGDLTALIQSISGPLAAGLASVAGIIGGILSDLAGVLGSETGITTINEVFQTTARILEFLRPLIQSFSGTFLEMIQASLPAVERLAGHLTLAFDSLDKFLGDSIDDGSFQAFLDEGIKSLLTFIDLIKSLFNVFGALFTPETAEAGRDVMQVFTDLFNTIAEFLKSEDGKQFLADLGALAVVAAKAIAGVFLALGVLFVMFTTVQAAVLDFFGVIDRQITSAEEGFKKGADNIVGFVKAVPDRLMALATFFADAGAKLIGSFIGGFRKVGNFIGDVAGDIAAGIKKSLNFLIGKLNQGIATLDAALPFSISRIPMLAEGGVASARPGGQPVIVGEGGEDEAIAPLSTLHDMISDAVNGGGPSIVFGEGSISINFNGAVPTENEARQTGVAVGNGIIAALTRANTRLRVRTA